MMIIPNIGRWLLMGLCLGTCLSAQAWIEDHAPRSTSTFEQSIRPILTAHCMQCHNESKRKGGLDLTSLASLAKGGSTGPVVEPGQAASSLLYQFLQKDSEIHMPPEGQLSEKEISIIREWIDQLPKDKPLVALKDEKQKAISHWAFQPVKPITLPKVKDATGLVNEIDYFVVAQLESRGLKLGPRASRQELIRRATFDLTGLPPTPEEVQAFIQDASPHAYEKLLDRLLAAPAYGERWGRHWLDVARYADSDGFEFDVDRPHAFRYRDYVIRSFNADKPYDRFILEQLAGDELFPYKPDALIATGFCRHGPTIDNQVNEKNRLDELDDIISTTSSVFLGLTMGCARCHDHKYDPISQKNYYEMLAIFNSREKLEYNVGTPEERERLRAHNEKLDKQIQSHRRSLRELEMSVLLQAGNWQSQARELIGMPVQNADNPLQPQTKLLFGDPTWTDYILECEVQPLTDQSQPWIAVRATTGQDLIWLQLSSQKQEASQLAYEQAGKRSLLQKTNQLPLQSLQWHRVRIALLGEQIKVFIGEDLLLDARANGSLEGCIGLGCSGGAVKVRGLQVKRSDGQQLWVGTPSLLSHDAAWAKAAYPDRMQRKQELTQTILRLNQDRLQPPLAMGIRDASANPKPTYLLLRGDHRMKGHEVQPGVPACLTNKPLEFPAPLVSQKTTGRRSVLARWLTDPSNPLTARVIVNRIWQWHFDKGLVETSSNFGLNGARASHPELLDWLAQQFMASGWQWKSMHKLIMLSATYQQSSSMQATAQQLDPNNVLLWRYPKKRIEAEALRDSVLFVSGKLNREMYGPGVKARIQPGLIATGSTPKWPMISKEGPEHWRRSVYLFVKRSVLHPLMEGFDAPNTTQSCERRLPTNVPTQALMLMNSDFINEQAGYFAQRLVAEGGAKTEQQVVRAYWLALGRAPTAKELEFAKEFLERQTQWHAPKAKPDQAALADFCHVLLNLNEFVYLP